MNVSFYIQPEDAILLQGYFQDYDEEAENPALYISNQPTSSQDLLITIKFEWYNELIDLELLEWL